MDAPLKRRFSRCAGIALLMALAGVASAQNFSFAYRTSASTAVVGVVPNSDINAAPTPLGATSTVTLLVTNNSTANYSISQVAVSGAGFALAQDPTGTVIFSNTTVLVALTFAPNAAGNLGGSLSLTLTNQGAGVTNPNQIVNFFLNGIGQQPVFVTSYILQPAGNQVAISGGGTLTLPPASVGSTSSATFLISNTGTGPGTVNSVGITGSGFALSGLTLLPAIVQPNGSIQFTITFQPTARGAAAGALSIAFGSGNPVAIQLAGQGIGAILTYTMAVGSQSSPLTPGGALSLPSTNLGASVSAAITVSNSGDAAAPIAAVSVVGAGYSLTSVPNTPATIGIGSSFTFNLVFNPQTVGTATGTLTIGTASFPLSAVATGASLTYSSLIGSASTSLATGGTVVFPNTNLGATSTIAIVVANNGNTAANIGGISVTGGGFSLTKLPSLPATVNPGASVQFSVVFTPNSAATSTGTLQIDSFTANLRGVANQPPPISSVSFGSLSATANPLDQPAVSLALSQPYALPISGTLTLTFVSGSFADDPNIQFASGGRTVNFTVPANTLNAVFGSAPQVQFQAGTVAGTITLTASLSVASVDVTPSPAPSAQVKILPAPPVISNVRLGATTANTFEVLITGLSTSRDVAAINLQFTPASGSGLQTTSLSINTEANFGTWFQSQTGISFGSQFTASIVVNVNGNVNAIQSVTVTASNSQGQSNPVSLSPI